MNIFLVIFLTFLQGITEFLPISSSGHLSLIENFYHLKNPLFLTVLLHFGSLLAIVVFFFNEIKNILSFKNKTLLIKIILGTLPLFLAIPFLSIIEKNFSNLKVIALGFLISGLFLMATKFIKKPFKDLDSLTYKDALLIGGAQLLALFPGFSRSGLTLSSGVLLKNKPEDSFKFSFLLSLPAILGATILETHGVLSQKEFFLSPLLIFLAVSFSFLFSYLALLILKKVLIKNKLFYFAFYLWGLTLLLWIKIL
ncbi:MAG: undecaprenyl-diphosphate phosphatase [Candidatus Paceibacterota bacterium]